MHKCGGNFGCYIVDSFLDSPEHQASYVHKASIGVHEIVILESDQAIEDTLIHEMGHLMGLHEQYGDLESSVHCQELDTVMNGPNGDLENCRGVHKPTAWDINAVTEYWRGEGLGVPVLSWDGLSTMKIQWKDRMWADGWQLTTLFNWDWDTSSWVQLDSPLFNEGIGFHEDAVDRTLEKEWNLGKNNWPTSQWYLAEVRHWSWRYEEWGPQVYSNMVYAVPSH